MTYEYLDERLINALLEDGRATLREIGSSVGVSVTTVSNHLRQLEEDGSIRGFSPIIAYDAFGYDVTAISHLKIEGSALPSITDWLADLDQFTGIYEITGGYDVVVIGRYRDTDEMDRHIKRLLADPDVRECNTSVVLNAVRDHEQFPLPVDGD